MHNIDYDKVQVRYLTGINKTLEGYPTPLDILYDCCQDTLDGTFYSSAKLENKYGLMDEDISTVIEYLLDNQYIEKKNKNYKIINTPWD